MESWKKEDGKGDSKRTDKGKRIWNKYGMSGLARVSQHLTGYKLWEMSSSINTKAAQIMSGFTFIKTPK